MMQAKVGIISMVHNFRMTISSKTDLPIKMDPTKFFIGTVGGLWIDMEEIGKEIDQILVK